MRDIISILLHHENHTLKDSIARTLRLDQSPLQGVRANRIDLLTLSVPAVERASIKLYEKLGFERGDYFLWKRFVD